ncbi:hypothetical protein DOTSEDRAFT_28011 [Dothistroma septosporum NZE10]|uniref:Uncharacterized protein n=1 Tax=Dothistroma septosporum (strain NZE10 / CBS 128990) TaxID=675120 RepID=N1PFM1_DOTSN|nr:hypothetical protein DOTSEDRAFT_28011 [Dothistroma septosporum NZE10]
MSNINAPKTIKTTSKTKMSATRAYNAGIDSGVAMNKPLPNCPIGIIELLVYFPHHTKYAENMMRLYRAGWRSAVMGQVQLHARDSLDKKELDKRNSSFRHQILTAGKKTFNDQAFGPSKPTYRNRRELQPACLLDYCLVISSTYNPCYEGVTLSDGTLGDANPFFVNTSAHSMSHMPATLDDLANGVVNHPTGEDAGILTQVIQWALTNGQAANYNTDDVQTIADQQGFVSPAEGRTFHWDVKALLRSNIPDPTS